VFGANEIVGQKYFDKAGDKLFVTSVFGVTLQGEGPYRGQPAVFVRLAKCNLNCSFCFVSGTSITMGDGSSKPIEQITVGDEVITWDNGEWIKKKVTETFVSETNELIKLEFSPSNTVWTTLDHPFYVKNKGWVKAQDLDENDVVIHFSSSERMKMFNPMFDKETASKVGESLKGKPGYLNKAWSDPAFRENNRVQMTTNNPNSNPEIAIKGYLNRKDRGKKSTHETFFEDVIKGLPIEFVGDGSLVVDNLVPDFVVSGQKKLIEIWPADQTEFSGRGQAWQIARKARFAKEGYDVLFLPFTLKDNKQEIRIKCSEFVNNGYTLIKKTRITNDGSGKGPNGKAWIRLAGGKGKSATVYNFEVEDTHNYVANNLLVHNCDTFFDDGDWMTISEIDAKIDQVISDHFQGNVPIWARELWGGLVLEGEEPKNEGPLKPRELVLVVTGGEPMLQKNLVPFLEHMSTKFKNTQIESNGTIVQNIPASTTLVVSPKCSERKGVAIKYLTPKPEMLARANCLKFVMNADPESPYGSVPDWAHEFRAKGGTVFVSPMNIYNDEPQKSKQLRATTNQITLQERSTVDEKISFWEDGLLNMKANQANHEHAARYCTQHGFIFNMQLHLFASLA
jgi:7-carboxy-7-deazaguanine synthase